MDKLLPYAIRPSWEWQAACAGKGKPTMFPHDGDSAGIADAKKTCAGCPVRTQCLKAALERDEEHGIWGGLTHLERKAVKRRTARRKGTVTVRPKKKK